MPFDVSAYTALRRRLSRLAVAAILPSLIMVPPARAAEFTDAQKAEMGPIIKSYLMQNPDVLRDVMIELDKKDKAQEASKRATAVRDQSDALLNSSDGEVLGNPTGKVTLVEFFDYNCGYCKRALDDMAKLLKTEPDLKVVLKDFPVLGPGSVEAAQVAIAVRNQLKGDKFWAFHYKLLSTHGPVAKAQALAAAKDSGVDMDVLAKDMADAGNRKSIDRTMELAESLSLTGTPSYVLGPDVVVGAVGYDELKDRLDNVVKCGKSVCS